MTIILVIFSAMILGGISREINKKTKIPYTPMLFIFGMIAGYYVANYPKYYQVA
jgi:hypothetical protein